MIISVLVITYNSSSTICQTLDSIIEQALCFGKEAEIIIGDDCSIDSTRDILNSYKEKYPNLIKLIYNENNLGVINNYFNVLANCTGKYVMECAGDDYWLPNKMITQIDYLENHDDIGMCCGNAISFYEAFELYEPRGNDKNKAVDFDSMIQANSVFTPTVCFRRKLANLYITDVDPQSRTWKMEDYPMWLWFSKNSSIGYIDKYFAVYRIGKDSLSHSKSPKKQLIFNKSTLEIQKFYARDEEEISKLEKCNLYGEAEIYLKYNDRKNYRRVLKLLDGKKNRIKYYLSIFPGYTRIVNFKRETKIKRNAYKDLSIIDGNGHLVSS